MNKQNVSVWLGCMAALVLSACGGGDHPEERNASPLVSTPSSAVDVQEQVDSSTREEKKGEAAGTGNARLTPAEFMGGRPTRPSELVPSGFNVAPPSRPDRTPQSVVMASLCQAQTWSWGNEGAACQGVAPATQAGGGQFITVENRLPATMGVKWMQCVRNSEGKPTWLPHVVNGIANESCTLRVVEPVPTEPLEILRRNNCMMCHSVDGGAILGPSFRQIADHYRDIPPPPGELENRIRLGGVGTFGSIPMAAQPQISNDALAIVVPWILSR